MERCGNRSRGCRRMLPGLRIRVVLADSLDHDDTVKSSYKKAECARRVKQGDMVMKRGVALPFKPVAAIA